MKYGEDFRITSKMYTYKTEHDLASIEVLTGAYEGVEFTFGSINVDEKIEEGEATISFDYTVHSNKKLEGDKDFELVLGEIMNSLLMHSLEEAEKEHERRKKDTETPDQ